MRGKSRGKQSPRVQESLSVRNLLKCSWSNSVVLFSSWSSLFPPKRNRVRELILPSTEDIYTYLFPTIYFSYSTRPISEPKAYESSFHEVFNILFSSLFSRSDEQVDAIWWRGFAARVYWVIIVLPKINVNFSISKTRRRQCRIFVRRNGSHNNNKTIILFW